MGYSGGYCAAGGGRRMLGPVSNEEEGAISRALSLVTCLLAGAGARARGSVVAMSRLCGYVAYQGGVHLSSRTCGCVCWRYQMC